MAFPNQPKVCAKQKMSMAFCMRHVRNGVTRGEGAVNPNILRCERAILRVVFFGERASQIGVKVRHHGTGGVQVLEEQEHEGKFIQEVDPKDNAPKRGVRPNERAVTELNH